MNDIFADKMSLGTAQFGMDYGIANESGRIGVDEAFRILEFAKESGIDYIDTAHTYGDSESVLGEFISKNSARFKVVSKLPDIRKGGASLVGKYFAETLNRLCMPKLYGYLIHRFDNIAADKALWPALESIREKGLAKKVGVSVYMPSELEYALDSKLEIDIVQFPYNVFDRRFEEYLSILRERGIEVHARSIFLQGLFFLDEERIAKEFNAARHMISEMRRIAAESDMPARTLCLCFALLNPLIDKVIIGVDSLAHLKENIDSARQISEVKKIYNRLESLRFHDENIILPYKWR